MVPSSMPSSTLVIVVPSWTCLIFVEWTDSENMIGKTIGLHQGCGKVRVAVRSSPSRAATMTKPQLTLHNCQGVRGRGAMTYAFIQAIERGHGTTYGSLLNAMRSTVHEILDKNKGRALVEMEGADLLTTLLGLLILGAAPTEDDEEVNQAPQKTQEPQLSANEAFAVYGKPFSL
uniref:Metacaspase-2 n=2 Tax=Noccaea caerulescens TaxID=107243 RepID=A0A1J3IT41_NOCCA